jgi:hypothetical protein
MSHFTGYPTLEQLELGAIVDCRGDDAGLGELRATRIKLKSSPGFPGRNDPRGKLGDIEVLVELPGREGWFRAGSLRGGFHTPWRAVDAALIANYLGRLARELGVITAGR